MKKGEKFFVAAILIISIVFLIGQKISPEYEENTLKVEVDREIVEEKNITSQTNEELTIHLEAGTATIEVKQGRARVVPMPREICPRGICSDMGWIDKPGQAIVCMPNKMIIQFEGSV